MYPQDERLSTVKAKTNAAMKLLGSEHRKAIERAINRFHRYRGTRYVQQLGDRAAGEFGLRKSSLKKKANRIAAAMGALNRLMYDRSGRRRDDVSAAVFSDFPMDAIDFAWWDRRIKSAISEPLPNVGPLDFDLDFAAKLAGELFARTGDEPSRGRSPNNKFVKLTGIICGQLLSGCPRPCRDAIEKLLASRPEQPTK
jgi:hypothetical protein